MESRESKTELNITWEGGFVTTCFSPNTETFVRSALGNARIKVQSGLDGPEDTVVVVSSARYIVLKDLKPE